MTQKLNDIVCDVCRKGITGLPIIMESKKGRSLHYCSVKHFEKRAIQKEDVEERTTVNESPSLEKEIRHERYRKGNRSRRKKRFRKVPTSRNPK